MAVTSVTRTELERFLRGRWGSAAPATYNRNRATVGSLFSWLVDRDEFVLSPATRLKPRKARVSRAQERPAQAIRYEELRPLWSNPRHRLRDRAFWALAYAAAGRANELLALDVEDLDLANREAQIIGNQTRPSVTVCRMSQFWLSKAATTLRPTW